MNIIIKTKNLELTGQLKKAVEIKIGGLEKLLKPFKHSRDISFDTFVDLERESKHHKKGDIFSTEVKIVLPGKNMVAKAYGENPNKTIADVKEELEVEIKKYKTKMVELPRRKNKKMGKELF